jgi:hypothetical protein
LSKNYYKYNSSSEQCILDTSSLFDLHIPDLNNRSGNAF